MRSAAQANQEPAASTHQQQQHSGGSGGTRLPPAARMHVTRLISTAAAVARYPACRKLTLPQVRRADSLSLMCLTPVLVPVLGPDRNMSRIKYYGFPECSDADLTASEPLLAVPTS